VSLAALLTDTIFSSDGVYADPKGFLAEAVRHVQAAGGLFIADRCSRASAGWRDNVGDSSATRRSRSRDDGKAHGQRTPGRAVAARPEVFARFAKRRHYFNTYGGNSVSCAAALAVLRVIREENLLENARRTGEHLKRGLQALAERNPAIGEVRGAGMFLGVELRPNPASGLAGSAETKRVVNGMCRRGVLVGSTGRHGDVLKDPFAADLRDAARRSCCSRRSSRRSRKRTDRASAALCRKTTPPTGGRPSEGAGTPRTRAARLRWRPCWSRIPHGATA